MSDMYYGIRTLSFEVAAGTKRMTPVRASDVAPPLTVIVESDRVARARIRSSLISPDLHLSNQLAGSSRLRVRSGDAFRTKCTHQ